MKITKKLVAEYKFLDEQIADLKRNITDLNRQFDNSSESGCEESVLEELSEMIDVAKAELTRCKKRKNKIATRYADIMLLQVVS